MEKTMAAACLLALAALEASAQDKAKTPGYPKPAPEMSALKGTIGTWNCDGALMDGPWGKGHETKAVVTVREDLGGFWVSGTVQETKTAENPMPMEGRFHQTYDVGAKVYVMLWVDNSGGWAQSTSPGWQGDTMVWTGEGVLGGQKVPLRDHFTKKGETRLVHRYEASMDGRWSTMGEETCTKAAK